MRMRWEDSSELIAEHWATTGLGGIMHCFSGSVEQAERSLASDFYLSFAGNLTYPKSRPSATSPPALPHTGSWSKRTPRFLRRSRCEASRTSRPDDSYRGIPGGASRHLILELAEQTTANFNNLFPVTR